MLSKKNRANKREIDKIFKKGAFSGSGNLILKYIAENNTTPPRVSFIAPKGVAKKAVDRNRLRRVGYPILKKYLKYIPHGFVGAFVFGKNSMTLFGNRRKTKNNNPSQNLETEIIQILKKVHYLK